MFDVLTKLDKKNKIIIILLCMLTFSMVYMILPDKDFSGVHSISELIKDEILKKRVRDDITKNTNIIEGLNTMNNTVLKNANVFKNTDIVEDVVEIENIVDDEYNSESLRKNIFEQYINRVYFSIITGCLLGYGDIYPVSIRAKILTMIQSLITIIIIVS